MIKNMRLTVFLLLSAMVAGSPVAFADTPAFPTPVTVHARQIPQPAAPQPPVAAPDIPQVPAPETSAEKTPQPSPGATPVHLAPVTESVKARIAPDSALQYDTSTKKWSSGNYVYDGTGNIIAIGNDYYLYDPVGRLLTGTVRSTGSHSQSATYDIFGNIKTITTDGVTNTPRLNSLTNRIDNTAGNVYGTYDGAGHMTSFLGSYTYSWDSLDMMTEMVSSGTGGRDEIYLYDANDERIATVTSPATPTYRYTLRGPDNKELRELTYASSTGQWTWTKDYVFRDGALLASITPGPAQETVQHYHLDHLGSPRLITDVTGAPVAFHAYMPFGGDVPGSTTDTERLRFTGHERDLGTVADVNALDYMHARYYSASLGRFLSVDPVSGQPNNPQSWNRYSYVLNNPVNKADPSGKCVWDLCIGEGAALWTAGVALAGVTTVWLNSPDPSHGGRTHAAVIAGAIVGAVTSLSHRPHIVTPTGVVLPGGKDVNLVPTAQGAGNGTGWVQIHDSHPHPADGGVRPHTHTPETNVGPNGKTNVERRDAPTTAADIDNADKKVRDGDLRPRRNRQDKGDPPQEKPITQDQPQ